MYILQYLCAFIALIFLFPVGYFVLDKSEVIDTQHIVQPADVGVYIINLDRSKERYDYIKDNIGALGFNFQRISGIDGNLLSDKEIERYLDLESYKSFLGHAPKRGTIGCSLSHIKAWRAFLNSNFEFAVIFEDDISFEPDKLKNSIEELIKQKELWDINIFEILHHGHPLTLKHLDSGRRLVVYLTEVTHAGAYIINRKAAKLLLEKALQIKMPIDHYFTRSWEFGLKFTGVEDPRLVHQTFGDSNIGQTSTLLEKNIGFVKTVKKCIYKIQSYIIRFLYNLKIYFFK